MIKTTYEDELNRMGSFTYTNIGESMMPMLKQGRDLFTVEKKIGRCRKYDVVLYKRPPRSYVLHRVVKVCENDYVILGDNCINKEYNIKDDEIIGVLKSFVRNGKEYTVTHFGYKIYSRVWYYLYPFRKVLMRLKIFIRKRKNDR
ncbi:MAG: S24/S26 family peptidase [Clostridia bacterium]|nr:S24/S26 family peptidase [Clostridia bacterium]